MRLLAASSVRSSHSPPHRCAGWGGGAVASAPASHRAVTPAALTPSPPSPPHRLSSRLNVALFIPVTATLISPFLCVSGATLGGSVQCSGPLYGLLLFVVTVVATLFASLTLLVTAVFYDSNPKSASAFSRAHARADVLKLVAELVLTVFFSLSTRPNPWAGTVLVFAGGVVWLGGILYYLPFFSLKTNAVFAGMASSFLWACCCLLIAVGVSDEGKGAASSAAFLLLIGIPFAATAGATLALVRLHMVQRASEQSVNPLAVEIRARMGLTPLAVKVLTAYDDESAASNSRVNREFAAAVKHFKDSSLLEVAFARFLRHYRESRSLELIHLNAAERKGPALESVTFLPLRPSAPRLRRFPPLAASASSCTSAATWWRRKSCPAELPTAR